MKTEDSRGDFFLRESSLELVYVYEYILRSSYIYQVCCVQIAV